MARYTLLEIVQRILGAMDSDEVNTIHDTTESTEVAKIVKESYEALLGEVAPKRRKGLFHLDSSTDNTKPCVMYIPDHVRSIEFLKYNVGDSVQDTNFRELCYLDPHDFFQRNQGLDLDQDWVQSQEVSFDGYQFNLKIRNDVDPYYFTSPDDRTVLFDSYDRGRDDTLVSARTYGYGNLSAVFRLEDDYIPELSDTHFTLLINMAKNQAMEELKQSESPTASRRERRHRILAKKTADSSDPRPEIYKRKGYGRK